MKKREQPMRNDEKIEKTMKMMNTGEKTRKNDENE